MDWLPYAREYLQLAAMLAELPRNLQLPSQIILGRDFGADDIDIIQENSDNNTIVLHQTGQLQLVQGDCRFDHRCDVIYFEVGIINPVNTSHMRIALGFHGYDEQGRHVHDSVHDDSHMFELLSNRTKEGRVIGGDVLGCGFCRQTSQIFFTKNGIWLEHIIFESRGAGLLPYVTYYAEGSSAPCAIHANFGRKPFVFNLVQDYIPIQERWARWKQIVARIPAEIIHMILLQVAEDVRHLTGHVDQLKLETYLRHLSNVSRVCRRWQLLTRHIRFQNVLIRQRSHLASFMNMVCVHRQTTAHTSPSLCTPIGPYVSYAKLHGEASERIDLLLLSSAPQKLTQLTTFVWDGDGTSFDGQFGSVPPRVPPRIRTMLPGLFQGFSTIESLVLRRHAFSSFHRLAQLVTSLPSLITLRLEDVFWPASARMGLPSWPCRSPLLNEVTLDLSESMSDIEGHQCIGLLWLFMGRSKSGCSPNPYAVSPRNAMILGSILALDSSLTSMFMNIRLEDMNGFWKLKLESWSYRFLLQFKSSTPSLTHLVTWTCSVVPIHDNADGLQLDQYASVFAASDALVKIFDPRGMPVNCRLHVYEQDNVPELWSMLKTNMRKMYEAGRVEVWAHKRNHAEWDSWDEEGDDNIPESELWRVHEEEEELDSEANQLFVDS